MIEHIKREAAARRERLEDAVRHHLIAGVVERIARSAHHDAFVLRGGLLTRAWIAPRYRPTRDLDFVGDFAFDRDVTHARFAAALATPIDDGVVIGPTLDARPMWVDSGFPGVRLGFAIGLGVADQAITVDVGFNDPLVPPAIDFELPRADGRTTSVRAVRPETQLAWKLHGLVEMGASFRPKDLADLALVARHVTLEPAVIPAAIAIAFTSRGYDPARARTVFAEPYWSTKTARTRWEAYAKRVGTLADVVTELNSRLENL